MSHTWTSSPELKGQPVITTVPLSPNNTTETRTVKQWKDQYGNVIKEETIETSTNNGDDSKNVDNVHANNVSSVNGSRQNTDTDVHKKVMTDTEAIQQERQKRRDQDLNKI